MTNVIYRSASNNDLITLHKAIEEGEDVNALKSWGAGYVFCYSALSIAVRNGHTEAVSLLLAANADVNQKSGNFIDGWQTPLVDIASDILYVLRYWTIRK